MRALALEHRQAPDEGVGGEGRVDVEVTEEDLLPRRRCLVRGSGRDGLRGDRRRDRRTRLLVTPATAGDEQRHDDDPQAASHGSLLARMWLVVLQQDTAPTEQKPLIAALHATGGKPARTVAPRGLLRGPLPGLLFRRDEARRRSGAARQTHGEDGAVAFAGVLGGDRSAVQLDDFPGDGETESKTPPCTAG